MILWRPVGLHELELIAAARFRAFPPRLPHQPIFYPVLTREYAVAIARDWNTQDAASGFAGFVTRFELDDRVALRYPVQAAGATEHRELWIPAEDLPAVNASLRGPITVEAGFAGAKFRGCIDATTHTARCTRAGARACLERLAPGRPRQRVADEPRSHALPGRRDRRHLRGAWTQAVLLGVP